MVGPLVGHIHIEDRNYDGKKLNEFKRLLLFFFIINTTAKMKELNINNKYSGTKAKNEKKITFIINRYTYPHIVIYIYSFVYSDNGRVRQ